jgi:hypothetical protein
MWLGSGSALEMMTKHYCITGKCYSEILDKLSIHTVREIREDLGGLLGTKPSLYVLHEGLEQRMINAYSVSVTRQNVRMGSAHVVPASVPLDHSHGEAFSGSARTHNPREFTNEELNDLIGILNASLNSVVNTSDRSRTSLQNPRYDRPNLEDD